MFRREGSLDEYPEVLPSGLIAVPVKFTEVSMFKLCIYVPSSHLEIVKSAIFTAGAGTIGAYSHCSWEVKGFGQFAAIVSPFSLSSFFASLLHRV